MSKLTDHDRETIKQIQERVGVDPSGEIDTATILAIHETLGLLQKYLTRQFRPGIPCPEATPYSESP